MMETIAENILQKNETWAKIVQLRELIRYLRIKLRSSDCYEVKNGDIIIRKLYDCGNCIDVLTCKCQQAKDFVKDFERNPGKIISEYNWRKNEEIWNEKQKKYIKKTVNFLNELKIKRVKRKISVVWSRIKLRVFNSFILFFNLIFRKGI